MVEVEGLKEEEEEGNHHQPEDEDEVEDGTQAEDEAEEIGRENLTTLMTSECRPTLIIMKTTGAERGASHLLEDTEQNSRSTRSEAINNREIIEVSTVLTAPLGVTWRTAFIRWASMRNI